MLLEKIKAKSQRGWHSFARIFTSRSKQRPRIDGRLFVLPYDLLEEIATYFSRREAASLLTVNSQFYDAFAQAIWRRLHLDDKLAKRIPASAWKTYGHLVRIATVTFRGPREHFDVVRIPNLVDLTLYLTDRGYSIFERAELNNLRRLHFNLPFHRWTYLDVLKAVELVKHVGRYGHSIAIFWDIYVMTHLNVESLDEILASIVNTEQYSFKITARLMPSAPLQHRPKLAEMITELNLSGSVFGLSCFLGKPSNSFPRLVSFTLNNDSLNEEYTNGIDVLNPDRFPELKRLTIAYLSTFDLEWFETAFSHSWPSISELAFLSSHTPLEFATIIKSVPNLQRLVVNGSKNVLDISQAVEYLPHLQHLEIDNNVRFQYDADRQPQPQLQLVKLKSFVFKPTRKMTQCFIRQHILNFILHGAPSLESIELNESCFARKALRVGRGHVNESVRILNIHFGLNRFDADTAKMFIEMFPNLRLLKLKAENAIPRDMLVDHSNKILTIHYVK